MPTRLWVLAACFAACEVPAPEGEILPSSDDGKADTFGYIKVAAEISYGQTSPTISLDGKDTLEVQFNGQKGDPVHIRVQASAPGFAALVDYDNSNLWFPSPAGRDLQLDYTLWYRGFYRVLFHPTESKTATFTVRVDGPTCHPTKSCESLGAECGSIDDGCADVSCGNCPTGQGCGVGGVKNHCGTRPPPDPTPAFPPSCTGKQMTPHEAYLRLRWANTMQSIGGYTLLESYRDCTGTSCGPWSQPAEDLRGGIELTDIGNQEARLQLSTDYCRAHQYYADCKILTDGISFRIPRVVDFQTCETIIWPNVTFYGVATQDCMSASASIKANGRETRYFISGFYF